MDFTDAGQLLDLVLVCAGLAVWGAVLFFLAAGRWGTRGSKIAIAGPLRVDRWDGLSIRHLLGVILSFLLAATITGMVISAVEPASWNQINFSSVLADGMGKLVAIAVMVFVANSVLAGKWTAWPIRAGKLWRQLLRAAGCYLAVYPLVNVLILSLSVWLVLGLLGFDVQTQHPMLDLLSSGRLAFWQTFCVILLAVVISPVAEELFFRGLLQNYLAALSGSPKLAIAISGLAFGLVHLPLVDKVLPLAVFGMILGWWYWHNDNLLQAILLHVIFNSMALILLALGFGG